MIGPDRAAGESPFEDGSDATVGDAAILQIAGELVRGATALFEDGNRYGAAALVRQLVEAEYLAWAFAKGEDDAEKWMRSTDKERMQLFRPYQLREQSGGLFRHGDYSHHCGKGGHPSPEGFFCCRLKRFRHYVPTWSRPSGIERTAMPEEGLEPPTRGL